MRDSYCLCFFFKQKTAYEMRISDWSSDVCSSDLAAGLAGIGIADDLDGLDQLRSAPRCLERECIEESRAEPPQRRIATSRRDKRIFARQLGQRIDLRFGCDQSRSEEHTSELQSLMRISYAVLCLKKKNTKHHNPK